MSEIKLIKYVKIVLMIFLFSFTLNIGIMYVLFSQIKALEFILSFSVAIMNSAIFCSSVEL